MNRKKIGFALVVATVFGSLLCSCVPDQRTTLPVPLPGVENPVGFTKEFPFTELGQLSLQNTKVVSSQPVQGRVLVKIDSTELLEHFRPVRGENSCELEWLRRLGPIPAGVNPSRAYFLGLTSSGSLAFGLVFSDVVRPREVQKLLRGSRIHPAPELQPTTRGGGSRVVTVTIDRRGNDPLFVCKEHYYALKPKSALQSAFRDVGVVSMRRIFRFAEIRDVASPGYFRVKKIDSYLDEARLRFPTRATRGYPDIAPAHDLENWFLLRLDGRIGVAKAINLLRNQAGVVTISADFPLRLTALPDDPEFVNNNQWGLRNSGGGGALAGFDVNITPAWDDTSPTVAPVTVAVIDSGFKEDLDELRNRLWTNTTEIPGDAMDNDCNGYVDDVHGITTYDPWKVIYSGPPCTVAPGGPSVPFGTHGTKIAGILAAQTNNAAGIAGTAGTCPVNLINISVGWCYPGATMASGSAELAEALLYAFVKGADIANLSLRTMCESLFLRETLDTVLSQGLVVVASAGNEGLRALGGADPQVTASPAGIRGVIGVGGTQSDGRRWPSSNYGPGLALVAPAAGVRTITFTSPSQTVAQTTTVSGTSASSPFVSGAAAVILAKYPQVTAPYMRDWLRATARDIVDPNGTAANLPGNDEWTGAGMLNAGAATTSLASSLDQPLTVDILVERDSCSNTAPPLYDTASGSPDLGITVAGSSLRRWWLEYGSGDSPTSWALVPNLSATLTSQPIDVPRSLCPSCAPVPSAVEVAAGHNYLNTDTFANKGVYTVKLVADNLAGRRFEAYDWFRVVRAMISFDADIQWTWLLMPGMSLVGRWGWPDLQGFVDIRPGTNYNIRFERDDGSLIFQLPNRSTTSPLPCWRGSAQYRGLLGSYSGGYDAPSAANSLTTYSDGWYRLMLSVIHPGGATDTDSLRIYVDNTHFPNRSGWPATVPNCPNPVSCLDGGFSSAIVATDMGGSFGRRILLFRKGALVSLDTAGAVQWTFPLINRDMCEWDSIEWSFARPVLRVVDVDGDGVKEIAVVGTRIERSSTTSQYEKWNFVYLLTANGTPYNSSWPIRFRVVHAGNYKSGVPAIYVADVAGDGSKELIFYEQPINYYGILDTDIRPGYLHVLDLNAQPVSGVWPKEFPPSQKQIYLQIGDLDCDGKDEMLLEPDMILIKGDGTSPPGWSTSAGAGYLARIAKIFAATPGPQVLQSQFSPCSSPNYSVTLKNLDGSTAAGWPQQFQAGAGYVTMGPNRMSSLHVATGQIVSGGDNEITLCFDKIRTLNSSGLPIAGLPEIELQGRCEGISLVDIDGDGQLEYLARVYRSRDDIGPNYRSGAYLDAYRRDGSPFSAGDNRWPIVLPPGNNTSAVDFDQDGGVEIVNVLDLVPYPGGHTDLSSRIEVLTVR
jgi:subtilisin family serine protease